MTAKEWDELRIGDEVVTFNGNYQQNGRVISKRKDPKNMRWIAYEWDRPNNRGIGVGEKRYTSVHVAAV